MQRLSPTLLFAAMLVLASACSVERANPPHYGLYFGFAMHAQVNGILDPSLPGPVDLELVRTINAGPELTPDRQEGRAPPFCMAFTFSSTMPPNLINADGGQIFFDGFDNSSFMDLTMGPMPGPPMPLPSPLTCDLVDFAGTKPYSCAPVTPIVMVPPGQAPWISDSTRVTVGMTGGTQIGEFVETDIASPPPLEPAFDLNTITPDDITVSWQPTPARWVMIEVLAQLMDGSAQAQVLCLERGETGVKAISDEMLSLLPNASDTNPLFIQTSATALELRESYEGWGSYMVGIGRGFFGMGCHISSGPCPPPMTPVP